jgi:hypothetical protein
MEVYEIILDSEPQPEPEPEPGVVYTKLADIKYPGTYNVKDAVVVYADGRMCIIGDYNDALPLFYTYFDGTYTADLPKQGDVIDITSEVIAFHNVLEFLNPQFIVTGSKNLNDYDYSPAISAFFSYTVEDGSDMTSYCSSSDPGIRLVNLRGKLAKDGQYFDLMVDGTSIIGNLKASDKTIFEEYAGIIVDVQGIAIGYNGVYMDILVTDITQAPMDIPTLESYLGYWDVIAYNVDKGTYEEWTNMYLGTFTDEETGEEKDFALLARAEIDGQLYFALEPADEESEEYVILKVFEDGDDIILESIEDDDEFEKAEDYFNDLSFSEIDYDAN